ncbi:MAG: MFS transporter [Verrucomicrobiales bacterium]|nr:MFS transporter [Verrucomicrobiales bacterium]
MTGFTPGAPPVVNSPRTVLPVLFALSLAHLLNDTVQSLIPATYPLLKDSLHLSFAQLGLITLCFQLTASVLQPLVGLVLDRHPSPFALTVGMGITTAGVLLLAAADSFHFVLAAAALVGVGSSIFHPEASRAAHLAAGLRRGFAQSLFQVGGNAGTALGPLLAALIIMPRGQHSLAAFSLVALAAAGVLFGVGRWRNAHPSHRHRASGPAPAPPSLRSPGVIVRALAILLALIFSKYFYLAALGNYYTFYLMDRFALPATTAQIYLFVFLFAVAAGTIAGGPIGDRIGRRRVIWGSILGVAPFTLALPYLGLAGVAITSVLIGLILSSAFSAILVYAQELLPGRVGFVSGLFFGFAFGMAGIGAAVLGKLADHTSIRFVFQGCAFLPLIGLLAAFLPDLETHPAPNP